MSVIRTDTMEFDWTSPVAVVGAGACGLTAALAARDAGADVVVLERDATPSGSTGMSYGAICAAGTALQRDVGIDDDGEALIEDIITTTRGETDETLARTIGQNAGATVDWLTSEHDIRLSVERSWTGLGHRQPRLHAPPNRSGEELMGMLLRACEQAGVDVLTSATVTELYVDGGSRVLGVGIARPDGAVEALGCDALILATCGFGGNEAMVREHIPELAEARYYGHESNVGDGINWGLELGAAVGDMGAYQALGSLATPQSMVIPHTLLIGGGIQVNTNGERFENELEDISGQALTILAQPGGVCWIVFDQRLHDHSLATYQEYRDADEINTAKQADSVEALADQTGLPRDALTETLQTIARLADESATDPFGRRFDPDEKLAPPYYAIRATGALFHTQGGLLVDECAQVMSRSGDPLPNLFAGGGTARSVSGPGGWGYLPGMGLCTAVTLGRLAGTRAAGLSKASR